MVLARLEIVPAFFGDRLLENSVCVGCFFAVVVEEPR